MIKRLLLVFPFVAVVAIATLAARQTSPGYVPSNGFVPDAATAIRIAEAVWIPIYGEEHIVAERPFKATLKDEVWTVTGKDLPATAQEEWSKRRLQSVMYAFSGSSMVSREGAIDVELLLGL